jgi:hypothetical protein
VECFLNCWRLSMPGEAPLPDAVAPDRAALILLRNPQFGRLRFPQLVAI